MSTRSTRSVPHTYRMALTLLAAATLTFVACGEAPADADLSESIEPESPDSTAERDGSSDAISVQTAALTRARCLSFVQAYENIGLGSGAFRNTGLVGWLRSSPRTIINSYGSRIDTLTLRWSGTAPSSGRYVIKPDPAYARLDVDYTLDAPPYRGTDARFLGRALVRTTGRSATNGHWTVYGRAGGSKRGTIFRDIPLLDSPELQLSSGQYVEYEVTVFLETFAGVSVFAQSAYHLYDFFVPVVDPNRTICLYRVPEAPAGGGGGSGGGGGGGGYIPRPPPDGHIP